VRDSARQLTQSLDLLRLPELLLEQLLSPFCFFALDTPRSECLVPWYITCG